MRKKSQSGTKSTAVTTVPVGELIPQPHGGAIRNGGPNSGGPGRPASAIREKLRGSFDERIAILESIADDEEAHPSDRVKSIDLISKYGIGPLSEVSVETVRDRLGQTLEIIRNSLPAADAECLISQLESVWAA